MSTLALVSRSLSLEDDNAVALSPEYAARFEQLKDICDHFNSPASRKDRIEFCHLVAQWERETRFLSSLDKICTHPAYQRIIGMGEKVLPLIFRELETDPAHWFWALASITGENPIQPHQRGNLKEMTRAWLEWARSHGY